MTYNMDEDDAVVPELNLHSRDGKGDYARLGNSNDRGAEELGGAEPPFLKKRRSLWWYVKAILGCAFLAAMIVVFIKWVGPFCLKQVIIPILNWESATFSTSGLVFVLFATVALFPALLLPSTPSMWVAGMTFGYGLGFLLILAGIVVGVSLPFLIGSLFYNKIQRWLEKHPKKASIIRLAGEGSWFHQFRAVTLIRISPFPYVIFNYASIATNVKYLPYLLGSLVGIVPEIFVAIYSGILIQTLADASQYEQSLSASQIIFDVVGFCLTLVVTIMIAIYAKRRLKELQQEEESLLVQD